MGNIRNDRRITRWPNGVVPYSIDAAISQIGRQQITTAMAHWSNVAPVRFVEHTDENDVLIFNVRNDECFSAVGRVGGRQMVGCEFPITPVVPEGSWLAFERQGDTQVDCVFVGTDGAVYVMWRQSARRRVRGAPWRRERDVGDRRRSVARTGGTDASRHRPTGCASDLAPSGRWQSARRRVRGPQWRRERDVGHRRWHVARAGGTDAAQHRTSRRASGLALSGRCQSARRRVRGPQWRRERDVGDRRWCVARTGRTDAHRHRAAGYASGPALSGQHESARRALRGR
ncbi:hypothetical protein CR152_27185 [Massilia violaceinigra]|uniref:Peptidase M12A domain-containing protein n=1 Tax=Massilia violaceinigra TaxID=2045208 RepID=A0A2D2DS25_9BURK|nr:hypothetical protein CR152_27185 [Massilia violaceinigra]